MQTVIAAIAAGASVLGVLYANLPHRGIRWGARGQAIAAAGLLPAFIVATIAGLALFLLCLPTVRPFAPGLTLGWGVLIGTVLGLLALVESAQTLAQDGWVARSAGLLSLACLGPAATLLLFHGYPTDALLGCALGAVMVAAISLGVRGDRPAIDGMLVFALATATLVGASRIGIAHFPRSSPEAVAGGYWALPMLLVMAGTLAVVLIPNGWRERWQASQAIAFGLVASAVAVAVAVVLQWKVLPGLVWTLPLYGLLTFAFLLWAGKREEGAGRPTAFASAAGFLILAIAAAGFIRLGGYGESLILATALPLIAMAFLGRPRANEPLTEALGIGGATVLALLVLSRVLQEQVGPEWALDFQTQYNLFALLLGSSAGFAFLAFARQPLEQLTSTPDRRAGILAWLIVRTLLLAIFIAGIPLAVTVLWGVKAVSALLAGLLIGNLLWMVLAAWTTGTERAMAIAAAPQVLSLAAALFTVQFAPLLLGWQAHRPQKLVLVGVLAVCVVLWVITDLVGRRITEGSVPDETP